MNLASKGDRRSTAESDVRLMTRVAKGEVQAQRELLDRVVDRVRRICTLLLSQRADADDAAQLSLIEILQSAATFRVAGSIERWADRITVRTALRHARAIKRTSAFFERWAEFDAFPAAFQEWLGHERLARDLQDYLSTLSEPRKEAFVLKHALGYTVEEIAELTDTPPGTVKDRLVLARKQLRRIVDRDIRLRLNTRRARSS